MKESEKKMWLKEASIERKSGGRSIIIFIHSLCVCVSVILEHLQKHTWFIWKWFVKLCIQNYSGNTKFTESSNFFFEISTTLATELCEKKKSNVISFDCEYVFWNVIVKTFWWLSRIYRSKKKMLWKNLAHFVAKFCVESKSVCTVHPTLTDRSVKKWRMCA